MNDPKLQGLTRIRGIYYYRPPQREGIRPRRISLRTHDISEAITRAQAIRRAHASTHRPGSLSLAAKAFLAFRLQEGTYTRNSHHSTTIALRILTRDLHDPPITRITTAHVLDWHHRLRQRLATATADTYLARASALFTWLTKTGRIQINPFDEVTLHAPVTTRAHLYCTKEQRDRLIATNDREDIACVLHLGFFAGLRINEILEAVPAWFHPTVITIGATPTFTPNRHKQHARQIPINTRLRDFLSDYGIRDPYMIRPEVTHGRSVYRWDPRYPFKTLAEKCELPWVTPHVMRHTFATHHAAAGTPMAHIAQWLGDSIDITYKNYVGFCPHDAHVDSIC